MAKYSDAGHDVILLYLTRGEASDPGKTYTEMAALRTEEAQEVLWYIEGQTLVCRTG